MLDLVDKEFKAAKWNHFLRIKRNSDHLNQQVINFNKQIEIIKKESKEAMMLKIKELKWKITSDSRVDLRWQEEESMNLSAQ